MSDLRLSYGDLERMGFRPEFIEDYQAFKREVSPQFSDDPAASDPNDIFVSNLNGFFVYTGTPKQVWYNPVPGQITGWVQVV